VTQDSAGWRGRLAAYFHDGAAGGQVLILSALAALIWANSPASGLYEALLHYPLGVSAGGRSFTKPLEVWINDALMAFFFLLAGLEIRREMVEGQLASLSRAAAPAVAAIGGMPVPAVIYIGFAWRDPAALRGWAVPIATDIAFSLAVLRVLGSRVPVGLRVFLTALAIIDDLAAILVIAVAYTENLDVIALAAGGAVWAGLALLNRAGVRSQVPYMAGFVLMWACFARSGVHPTLAGVAVAFVVPMQQRDGTSPAHALEHFLNGWVAYLILPLFGLANAGLHLSELSWRMIADPVVPGVLFGLLLGKPLGVFGFTWLGAKLKLIRLPAQLSWQLLFGAALLCGIGFTMSLFIGHLAFEEGVRELELKLAIFTASLLSAAAGLWVLARATRQMRPGAPRLPA